MPVTLMTLILRSSDFLFDWMMVTIATLADILDC